MNDCKPTFAEPCIYLAAQTYEIESPAIYYVCFVCDLDLL